VSRPPCIDDSSLVYQVGRLYPSSADEYVPRHTAVTPMCFEAAFATVAEAAECARGRVDVLAGLIRDEPRLRVRRLLVDWLDAHFPVLAAADADPAAPMTQGLYPECVVPRRRRLLEPWTEVAYQSALPPHLTLSPAEKVMRKARGSCSLRYVTQQVRRAFGSSAPGTADLLKVAVVVSELRYFAPDEGIGLDPAARYAVWARTDRQHLAAFNAQKRGAKELREMLLQTAVGAASYSPVARFLYTRESATFFESVLLLQLCQKVMSRGDQTVALPPEPGFGVKLSEAAARDVLPILTVPGGGHPSAKRLNLALARCPELGRAARRQTSAISRVAVVAHNTFEFARQQRHPPVWVPVCPSACAWKRTSRKRRRDAVAVVGDAEATCGACGHNVVLLKVNGTLIRDAAGVWTQLCSGCGAVITSAHLVGVVGMCAQCRTAL